VGVLALAAPADGASRATARLDLALVTRGPVDTDWLHALADRHRLTIRSGGDHT